MSPCLALWAKRDVTCRKTGPRWSTTRTGLPSTRLATTSFASRDPSSRPWTRPCCQRRSTRCQVLFGTLCRVYGCKWASRWVGKGQHFLHLKSKFIKKSYVILQNLMGFQNLPLLFIAPPITRPESFSPPIDSTPDPEVQGVKKWTASPGEIQIVEARLVSGTFALHRTVLQEGGKSILESNESGGKWRVSNKEAHPTGKRFLYTLNPETVIGLILVNVHLCSLCPDYNRCPQCWHNMIMDSEQAEANWQDSGKIIFSSTFERFVLWPDRYRKLSHVAW